MNWHEALRFTVKQFEGRPVMWGISDCCQFANSYWERLTGENLAADFDYENKHEAGRILATYDGIDGLLEHLLGDSGPPQPGSIVLVPMGEHAKGPGVYTGYCVWGIHPDEGLVRFDAEHIEAAWSCPQP